VICPSGSFVDYAQLFPVIARSASDEAIQITACSKMDCFAALAMTAGQTES
jgi:hypothetical protein